MKPTAILLNASRGRQVDDDALLHASHHHLIAGAELDTHNREPLGEASPYFRQYGWLGVNTAIRILNGEEVGDWISPENHVINYYNVNDYQG